MVQLGGRRAGEEGAVAIFMAIFICFVMIGLSALVVDLGMARDTRQASQISADASALAAANALYPSSGTCATANDSTGSKTPPCYGDAVNTAKVYAQKNFKVPSSDWTTCTDPSHFYVPTAVTGSSQCISFTDSTLATTGISKPTKARVRIPDRKDPAGFGGIYGANSYTLATAARATLNTPVSGSCALCFLGSVTTNNTDFTVQAASIAVDGDITSGPQSYWSAGSIMVAGQVNNQNPNSYTSSNFTPNPGKTHTFQDPYGSQGLPTTTSLMPKNPPVTNCNTTLQPGIYSSVAVGSNSTCILAPGLYIITGAWTEQSTNSTFKTTASGGVTLFFTCGTPSAVQACTSATTINTGGYLDGKNGTTILNAGASPDFSQFALIYDRSNPNPINLQGNGNSSITGAVYAPKSTMEFNGNSAFVFNGGPIVVGGADSVGNTSGIIVNNGVPISFKSTPKAPTLDQ